jgi:hypothetical protein
MLYNFKSKPEANSLILICKLDVCWSLSGDPVEGGDDAGRRAEEVLGAAGRGQTSDVVARNLSDLKIQTQANFSSPWEYI